MDNRPKLNLSNTGLDNTIDPTKFNFSVNHGIMIRDNANIDNISVDPINDDTSLSIYKSNNKHIIHN